MPSAKKRFRATLTGNPDAPDMDTAVLTVPFDVHKVFGVRARLPVRVTINGYTFRSSIFPMGGGKHYMVVNKAARTGAKVKAGDTVTVVMEKDDAPRVVKAPPDLARALRANPAANAAWDKLSYSHRKEYVDAVTEARKPETRARRIEKTIEALAKPKPKHG